MKGEITSQATDCLNEAIAAMESLKRGGGSIEAIEVVCSGAQAALTKLQVAVAEEGWDRLIVALDNLTDVMRGEFLPGFSAATPKSDKRAQSDFESHMDEDGEKPGDPTLFDDDEQGGDDDDEKDDDDEHPMRSEADQRELDDHPYPTLGHVLRGDEDEPTNGRDAAREDDRRWDAAQGEELSDEARLTLTHYLVETQKRDGLSQPAFEKESRDLVELAQQGDDDSLLDR